MASRRQKRLRKHIFAGYLLALFTFTAWMGASAWAGSITAEQPAGARYSASR
ncbi:hypothetical protein D3C80_2118000 [compost metagenome]